MNKLKFLSFLPRTISSCESQVRTCITNSTQTLAHKSKIFHQRNPLISNCLIYGSITGLTEFSQQTVQHKILPALREEEKNSYDVPSLLRYTSLGCLVFGPVLHYWYRWLDRKYPSTALNVIVKKVSLDLVVLGIPLYAFFYVFINLLEGNTAQQIKKELDSKLLITFLAGAGFWMPAQALNFRYIPAAGRILYISICTFVEVNILALIKKTDI